MAGVYDQIIVDLDGQPVAGATVLVLLADTNTAATLTEIDGATPLANPITSSDIGRIQFFAADGIYDLRVSTPGSVSLIEDVVISGGIAPDGAINAYSGLVTIIGGTVDYLQDVDTHLNPYTP